MQELIKGIIYTFGSSSALYTIIKYEKQRDGADMLYRFNYRIYVSDRNGNPNPYGFYSNNLQAKFNLNGNDVWTQNTQSSSSGWNFEYTSSWIRISNKTSGIVPLIVSIKDTINPSWCNYTSPQQNLPIDPAGSDFKSVPNFNIGQSFVVTLIKYASSMYDKLVIKLGNTTIKTINGASDSNTISFTSSELNTIYGLMINDAYKDFTFELTTYTSSSMTTIVGVTKTKTARGTIINSNPTIDNVVGGDVNQATLALTGDSLKVVINQSTMRATITASGQNRATIQSITVNGKTATNGVIEFQKVNTNIFNIVVTDSRGFQTSQTITLPKVDYIDLTLSASGRRNQPTDGNIVLSYSGNYFKGSFGATSNTLTAQYRYTDQPSFTSEIWHILAPTISSTTNTYSQNITISNFDYRKDYLFQIKVNDKLITRTANFKIIKGEPIIWWNKTSLNVNGDLNLRGNIVKDNLKFGFESGSNENGNWIKYSDGTLIQYGLIDKTDYLTTEIYSSTSQGIIFYRSNNPIKYLPLSFIDTNYIISLSVNNRATGTRALFTRTSTKYVNRFESQLIGFDGFRSGENDYTNLNYVEWIAIGRWK